MKQYTFSIILPVHATTDEKVKQLTRAIASIKNQTYPKDLLELIIVNDGSTVPVKIPKDKWIRVINQPNMQRITAYQTGFEHARYEVFFLLDSDDKYVGTYLEKVNQLCNDYPDYSMFNFGSIHIHKDGRETMRDPFEPKELEVGHEIFGGGNIVNGTFVFKKEVFDKLGAFPQPIIKNIDCTELNYPAGGSMIRELTVASPYDFSAYAQIEFPEIRQYFMVDVESEPNKVIKELGNPFGQDYYLFYKYTRKYKSKPIKEYLYIVYHR
jgi:glycosyltransferase involved in cell wall biosynthesis